MVCHGESMDDRELGVRLPQLLGPSAFDISMKGDRRRASRWVHRALTVCCVPARWSDYCETQGKGLLDQLSLSCASQQCGLPAFEAASLSMNEACWVRTVCP